jgi:hypothetical protein
MFDFPQKPLVNLSPKQNEALEATLTIQHRMRYAVSLNVVIIRLLTTMLSYMQEQLPSTMKPMSDT